ncbi:type VI secretion system ATPase TssH [Niveispirillum fermenti]|uniref:type VI secretion system ATPase TssH n=1 Tax=Niveispirillum fermenti TaxID=1233113 RepID=UPI003A8540D9
MSISRRDNTLNKLSPPLYAAMAAAVEYCQIKGHALVEPVHLFHQCLLADDPALRAIMARSGIVVERLHQDICAALERLPRDPYPAEDFALSLWQAVERGWVVASLLQGAGMVDMRHLLIGMLEDEGLARVLADMSLQFTRIGFEALSLEVGAEGAGPAVATDDAGPDAPERPAPALMGRRDALNRFSTDLTARAREGRIDPVTGRDAEVRLIIDILMRRRQNNPILTGEAGVGKTAVVEGLALRIAAGDVPPALRQVELRSLDLGLLQAGAGMRGEFEQRLRQVIDEVQAAATPVILFIDEAHTLVGAGDAANLLKPALARGTLRTVAATTWSEYKRYFEKDPALTRRFQVVEIPEPSAATAIDMLRGVAGPLAAHHGVQILDEAVEAAVTLSQRYIPARQLPDKAVSVLDTAAARVAIGHHAVPAALQDCRRAIAALETEQTTRRAEHDIGLDAAERIARIGEELSVLRERQTLLDQRWADEKARVTAILAAQARLRGENGFPDRGPLLESLAAMRAELEARQGETPLLVPAVGAQAVAEVVGDWTGIPVGRMLRDQSETVLALADRLAERVIGQDHALERIAQRVQTARAGLDDPGKPVGVFLLCGPSGVGKTETALALADLLYGGEQNLITINMSEFQEAHTVSTLKGAPPGYVGYGEGGVLTEAVRRRPHSVVLLDEVEKAHPDVHEIFFQVFDKGAMEDGEGRRIDFRNTLFLLTSNVGSGMTRELCRHGTPPRPEDIAAALREPLLAVFPDALLGRMVVLPYYPLGSAQLRAIIGLQLDRIARRVAATRRLPFTYDDRTIAHVLEQCVETDSGGRMIDAILTGSILPTVAHAVLKAGTGGPPVTRVHVSADPATGFLYDFGQEAVGPGDDGKAEAG